MHVYACVRTYMYVYAYIYIYICVCVSVCACVRVLASITTDMLIHCCDKKKFPKDKLKK